MKALVLNSVVIAVGDPQAHADSIEIMGSIYPLEAIAGHQLMEAHPPVAPGWSCVGGNFSPPAVHSPTAVPQTISRAQAKLALIAAGLLGNVQPAINAIADPMQRAAAQIEWDERPTFERTNPTLLALATAMGMTSEELDALFVAAASL